MVFDEYHDLLEFEKGPQKTPQDLAKSKLESKQGISTKLMEPYHQDKIN